MHGQFGPITAQLQEPCNTMSRLGAKSEALWLRPLAILRNTES